MKLLVYKIIFFKKYCRKTYIYIKHMKFGEFMVRNKSICIFVIMLLIIPVYVTIAQEPNYSNKKICQVCKTENPCRPIIRGPSRGIIGTEYEYHIVTTDLQNDDVCYRISWGDGSVQCGEGPCCSGEEISIYHAWCEKCYSGGGEFRIRVDAKDSKGYRSEPCYYNVEMIRIKDLYFDFGIIINTYFRNIVNSIKLLN